MSQLSDSFATIVYSSVFSYNASPHVGVLPPYVPITRYNPAVNDFSRLSDPEAVDVPPTVCSPEGTPTAPPVAAANGDS